MNRGGGATYTRPACGVIPAAEVVWTSEGRSCARCGQVVALRRRPAGRREKGPL